MSDKILPSAANSFAAAKTSSTFLLKFETENSHIKKKKSLQLLIFNIILSKYLPSTYLNNQNLLSVLWIITTHSFKLYKSNSETLTILTFLNPITNTN